MRRTKAETEAFLRARASEMRRSPTKAEWILWDLLLERGFNRQVPITGETKNGGGWCYIADFFKDTPLGGLIVEVDGGYHRKTRGRDRRRSVRLEQEGFPTLRFTNSEVLKAPQKVVDAIEAKLKELNENPAD